MFIALGGKLYETEMEQQQGKENGTARSSQKILSHFMIIHYHSIENPTNQPTNPAIGMKFHGGNSKLCAHRISYQLSGTKFIECMLILEI